jgi:tight adherence protein B
MKILLVTLFALFLIFVLVIELLAYSYRSVRGVSGEKARKRLQRVSLAESPGQDTDILRKKLVRSTVPMLNEFLARMPGIHSLQQLTMQARTRHPPSVFLLLGMILALLGYWIVSQRTGNLLVSLLVAMFLGSLPFYYLKGKRRKRIERFQQQLPEALEMTARGLRAGHAFTTGMRLVAEGFEDPLGTEFRTTLEEINFGVSVADALKNLIGRVDCPDLRFFVVSSIIQRETGGNMADIMDSIARIQRHRFSFNEKVRVLSAEARLSAKILIALPLLIMAGIRVMNPDYLSLLFTTEMGRGMLAGASFMLVVGIFVIMRMVKIEV